ncbi:ras guanine nucleotide exchange factor domain-containing protein [Chytridium lagenaria]|nr:ras guanine nucleotide exchange factor domain-containing protein [Chytridium lagenaria]
MSYVNILHNPNVLFSMIALPMLQPKLDINIQDDHGNTALHVAAEKGDLMTCYTLLAAGSQRNVMNNAGLRPIDLAPNPKIKEMLSATTVMSGPGTISFNMNTINSKPVDFTWIDELPKDAKTLRLLSIELIDAQDTFQERCKETILQLIEEKHIALCKNRLLEQAAGITDKDTSMRFIDQLQYWQDESERQSATIAYLKIRLNMLEMGALQQEEYYRKNLADLTKQHTEQLQAIFRRNEETEKAFLAYQKAHSEEFAELSRLRAEAAAFKGRAGVTGSKFHYARGVILTSNLQMQSMYSQLQSLKKELSEVQADKKSLEERLKLSDKLKTMTERENAEIRADINKLRKTLQEEMINQLQGSRREQDEKDESTGAIIFIKGEGGSKRIKGATPEKLVEHNTTYIHFLTPLVDNQFLQVFMLTYKVFMTSRQLMDNIVRIFKENSKSDKVAGDIGFQPPILLRIVNTIKFWLENYWCDFQEDPSLLKDLTNFIDALQDEKLINILQTVVTRKLTSQISLQPDKGQSPPRPILPRSLAKRLSTDQSLKPQNSSDQKVWAPFGKKVSSGNLGSTYASGASPMTGSPGPLSAGSVVTANGLMLLSYEDEFRFKLIDLEPLEIARQITIIESDLFLSIQVREFLDLAWMKDDKEIRAPNITRMIQWSNHVVHWIVSEIVAVKDSIKTRAQMFEKFIQVAQHLDKLNNFNGVKEVLAALQSSSVYRLKKTKELVANKYLRIYDELLKLISSELNYKALRAKVHATDPPLIPFPGVYQGDLVFLDTCSKDVLENGLINFHKFQKVASYILEIQNYQQAKYALEPVVEIQEYLKHYPVLNDDQAYTQSLICEARGS